LKAERARDLDAALVAVRQLRGHAITVRADADEVEERLGALAHLEALPPLAGKAGEGLEYAGAPLRDLADHDVLERAQVTEQPDVLERPRDAHAGKAMRRKAG